MRLDRQRISERFRHDVAGWWRGTQRLRLAQRLAVDGMTGGEPHLRVGPGGLRVPHVEKVKIVGADAAGEGELQRRVPLDLLGHGRIQQIGEIDLAALQHGQARRGLRHAFEHQPLDRRHLSPVALVGLHDELDAGLVADELVGPETDRGFQEAVSPDPLEVLLGHDPASARGEGAVESQEIGPRLVQHEAHLMRIGDHHLLDFLVQQL